MNLHYVANEGIFAEHSCAAVGGPWDNEIRAEGRNSHALFVRTSLYGIHGMTAANSQLQPQGCLDKLPAGHATNCLLLSLFNSGV